MNKILLPGVIILFFVIYKIFQGGSLVQSVNQILYYNYRSNNYKMHS